MPQINLKQLLAGDGQQEYIDKLNFNFGQISQFGGGPPGLQGLPGGIGLPGGRGPLGLQGPTGLRGSEWTITDTDPTLIPDELNKDLVFNKTSGHLFYYDGTSWIDEGKLVGESILSETNGTTYYSAPLYNGAVKSLVLSPISYKPSLVPGIVTPLAVSSIFRPVLKVLSNNLVNPFLVFGSVDPVTGIESTDITQIGMYLDKPTVDKEVYDFTISNSAGSNTLQAGPNHFKIGKDDTYRFRTAGVYDRLTFDLSDLTNRYFVFNGDDTPTGNIKLHIGRAKSKAPSMTFSDLSYVGINNTSPESKLHVSADPLDFAIGKTAVAQIIGTDAGNGNFTKLQVEFKRTAQGVANFETNSAQTTIVRLDGNARGGFISIAGGDQAGAVPNMTFGFNDQVNLTIDPTSLTFTKDVTAVNSLTVGTRSGLVGIGSVAIGTGVTATHANSVVVGSGSSQAANSIFFNNPTGIKVGAGSITPAQPYFTSTNPLAVDAKGLQTSVATSIQHDGSVEGLEIVGFSDGTNPARQSLLVTNRSIGSFGNSYSRNLFSVGASGSAMAGPLTIGSSLSIPIGSGYTVTPNISYYEHPYSLSLNSGLLFNTSGFFDRVIITPSTVSVSVSTILGNKVKRQDVLLKGADIYDVGVTDVPEGGNLVLAPGLGSNKKGDTLAGNIILGHDGLSNKIGSVLIGKNKAQSFDTLQVVGGAYFERIEKYGSNALSAVQVPTRKLQFTTAFSGYVSDNLNITRDTIENTFTSAGKLAHSWTSDSVSPDPVDVHATNETGVFGSVSASQTAAGTNGYAAYFEDNRITGQNPTVYIKRSALNTTSLLAEGNIRCYENVIANDFIPQKGWLEIPVTLLNITAIKGGAIISPAGTAPNAVAFDVTPFECGDRSGEITNCSFKVFSYGNLITMTFHFTISLGAAPLTGVPDSYRIDHFPFQIGGLSMGNCFAFANNVSDGAGGTFNLSQMIPVVAESGNYPRSIQIQLPKSPGPDSIWGKATLLHCTGTISLNGQLYPFTPPDNNLGSGSGSTSAGFAI